MAKQNQHIDYDKIAAYLSGEGSVEEQLRLEKWIQESAENREFFEECRKIFSLDYAIQEVPAVEVEINTGRAWGKVYAKLDLSEIPGEENDIKLDIPDIPEESEVIEMPSESRSIWTYPWVRVAAAVVIGLSAVFLLLNRSARQEITLASTESIEEYYLADSTKIVLDAGATLTYRKNYGQDNRSVELKGKAYFDVRKDDELEFVISTDQGLVQVLGTAFQVFEYNDTLLVIVERGRVQMSSESIGEFLVLERYQKGIIDLKTGQKTKEDLEDVNELYWANKRLTYRQESLIAVFEELAVLFDKDIEYDPKVIDNCRMTGVFLDQSFEEIIKNMALSMEFEYIIDSNKVVINSNGCETE